MIDKIKKYTQLAVVLFVAFVISNVLINEIFISKSPLIRPQLGSYLIARIKEAFNPSEFMAFIAHKTQKKSTVVEKETNLNFSKLQEVAFTQIVPGIKARANENISETSYELGKIKWIKHKVKIDEIEHEYGWPEGKELPLRSTLENMFR